MSLSHQALCVTLRRKTGAQLLNGRMKMKMQGVLFGMLSLVSLPASAVIEVAILDTGVMKGTTLPLCRPPLNHTADPSSHDVIGHGEHVARALLDAAGGTGVCFEVHKVVNRYRTVQNMVKALKSIGPRVKVVNISLGPDQNALRGEYEAFKRLLARGVGVVLAAGNNPSIRLTEACTWFPQCYRFSPPEAQHWWVVGDNLSPPLYSTGPLVRAWAWPYYKGMSGTSFAAPRVAGQLVRRLK